MLSPRTVAAGELKVHQVRFFRFDQTRRIDPATLAKAGRRRRTQVSPR
jgi:hypothetical protein